MAIAAVKQAVKSGRLSVARIDQSVRRILKAKQFTGAPEADPDRIFRTVDSPEHVALAEEIARRALTLVRRQDGILPLRSGARVALIVVSDFPDFNPMQDLERELRQRANVVQVTVLDSRSRQEELPPAVNADVAVVAFAVRTRSGAGSIAVPPAARHLVASLKLPLVGISFGSPYLLREVPALGTYICAYGIQPVMQIAAAKAIFGEADFAGKLPVTI
jgi:beta-N-acetylhexosaminidase